MYIIYLVNEQREGVFGSTLLSHEVDLIYKPSECFWLVPNTQREEKEELS